MPTPPVHSAVAQHFTSVPGQPASPSPGLYLSAVGPIGIASSAIFFGATLLGISTGIGLGYASAVPGWWRNDPPGCPPLPVCEECHDLAGAAASLCVAVTDRKLKAIPGELQLYSGSHAPDETPKEERKIPKGTPVLVCPQSRWQPIRLYALDKQACAHPRTLRIGLANGPPPGELMHTYGPLLLYRTAESVRHLADWFAAHGDALRSLLWYERATLIRADRESLGEEGDTLWARYEKLKALALAPGTKGEGEAALRAALGTIRKLAGGNNG